MSTWLDSRGGEVLAERVRSLVARAGTAAAEWLVAPPDPARAPAARGPVVAVVGLAPRCGGATVARALACELALRAPERAALVWSEAEPRCLGAFSGPGRRLAAELAWLRPARAAGRLCLVHACPADHATSATAAPVVLEVSHGGAPARAAALADAVVLVAGADVDPALALAVRESLARIGPPPLIALNRAGEGQDSPDGVTLPAAPFAARAARLAGRLPVGLFAEAVAGLCDRVEEACG